MMTGWTEGKPWEIARRELSVGKERYGSDGKPWEIAWGELRRTQKQTCWHGFSLTNSINAIVPKNCAPKTFQVGLQALGDGTCIASLAGSDTKKCTAVGTGFSGQISSIRLFRKNVRPRPKTCQSFQTLAHGTCIAWSETKRAELLARICRTNSINAIVPKNGCQRLFKRCLNAGQRDGRAGHAWGKVLCWRGFHFARRSVRRCLVFAPLQRSKLNDNPSIGYASA